MKPIVSPSARTTSSEVFEVLRISVYPDWETSEATPEVQFGPKIGAWPSLLAAAFGSREELVRPTVRPKNEASVAETVKSPVSRLTVPGPICWVAAPLALRSMTALTPSEETAALFGPVKSARIWTVPSGLTVDVAFQVSAGLLPPFSATGQVTALPPLVTSAAGTVVHASASERRQEKLTALYFAASASAISGRRAAVRVPSLGEMTPPAPTWKVYDTASDLFSALSVARTWRVWVPALSGVTVRLTGAVEPPVGTFVQLVPSSVHSRALWSPDGGVTVNTPAWPAPLTHCPDG